MRAFTCATSLFISFCTQSILSFSKNVASESLVREQNQIVDKNFVTDLFDQVKSKGEQHQFQSHVTRLLNIFAKHMYISEDAFIRELIANACDAISKARLEILKKASDANALGESSQYKIIVKADKEAGLLTITDNGIGMTGDEMKEFLGTIAKSGTAKFNLEKIADKDNSEISNLIGQFGVGFYSVLLVADKVAVVSKNDKDPKQMIWQSDASATYTLLEDPRGITLTRGTQIILKLKDNAKRFLDDDELEKAIKKYFEHDNNSIYLVKHETKEVPDEKSSHDIDSAKHENNNGENVGKTEELNDDSQKEPKTEQKTKKIEVEKEVLVSQQLKPIWKRDPKDISEEEYNTFYKTLTKDHQNPAAFLHLKKAESITAVDFSAILYIPSRPPFNAFSSAKNTDDNIKLHVRGVFVTSKLENFLPKHLSFIRGIVDSDDLPLNISRDMLQNNDDLRLVQKKIITKSFEMIENLSKDSKKYKEFYQSYGSHLKMEIIEEERYRSKLAKLLRYQSSTSKGELVSLDEYIERLNETDKSKKLIYFLAGSSIKEVERSPFLEKLNELKKEVLFLVNAEDEHCIQALNEYNDFKFQSIAKDGLKLDEEDSEDFKKKIEEEFKPLTDWLKKSLSKDVENVVISQRLTKSPCAVVASQWGWTGNMERVISAQTNSNDPMMAFFAMQKKIFEINPKNALIKELLKRVNDGQDLKNLRPIAKSLYDSTLVWSGYAVKDTKVFANNIDNVIRRVLGIEAEILEEEPEDAEVDKGTNNFDDFGNEKSDDEIEVSSEKKSENVHEEVKEQPEKEFAKNNPAENLSSESAAAPNSNASDSSDINKIQKDEL